MIVANWCALDQPECVERLLLVSTFASASTLIDAPNAPNSDGDDSVGEQIRRSLQPEFASGHPDLVDAIIQASVALERHPAVTDRSIELFLSHDGHDLSKITAPATVLCGTEDSVFAMANSELIARLITGSRLVRLPAVGHAVHLEAPQDLARAIRR